jgi:putative transposase
MLKAYEYRIFPTKEQEQFLLKTNGLCRLYWNTCLAQKHADYKWKIGSYKAVFEAHKPEAIEWCKEVDSTALAAEWNNITSAFNNFFKSCKGERKLSVNAPRFKSKKAFKVSVSWTSMVKLKFINGKLFVTKKLGLLDGTWHRFAEGKLRHCTISQTKTGKWFIKICVEKKDEKKTVNEKSIGIDWNCRDDSFLTMSDGTKVKCPRYLRQMEVRLARHQRRMDKKFVNGANSQSKNYEKAKYKVARLHEKVANQRKDWLHKLSRQICSNYENIFVEDINLQRMSSDLHHGKVVGDQGFGMLRTMIEYKGCLYKVDPKNTSRTCHNCGEVNESVVVGIEKWTCPICGAAHDRDINAAINILNKGIVGRELAESTNACGVPRCAAKQEVSVASPESV